MQEDAQANHGET